MPRSRGGMRGGRAVTRPVCTKRGYPSKKAARLAHASAHWRIKVYECPECFRFHVANAEKRGARRRDRGVA